DRRAVGDVLPHEAHELHAGRADVLGRAVLQPAAHAHRGARRGVPAPAADARGAEGRHRGLPEHAQALALRRARHLHRVRGRHAVARPLHPVDDGRADVPALPARPVPVLAGAVRAERVTRAVIAAVVDEMTHGRCIDTNSAWLAREIETCGLAVARIHVVCDAQDEIAAVLREAGARADWVVVTGGLGPTLDDRTRDAAAAAAGVDLVHDEAAWQAILGWFARVGRRNVPESNRRQALFPRGAEVLANDRGTAPGFVLRIGRARVAVLPGVPAEMK